MRRSIAAVAVCLTLLVAACSGERESPTAPTPDFGRNHNPPPPPPCSLDQTYALITQIFARGAARNAALAKLTALAEAAGANPPGPNPAVTRQKALNLVDFILKKYFDGHLVGGTSATTAQRVSTVLTGVLCLAGLPPFNPAALGLDAAAVVVLPNSPTTTIVTGTGFAGMEVQTGSVSQPTLLTITRLPDSPGPLLTQFDQYPIFYELNYNPSTTFNVPVVVALCISEAVSPPDPERLRLAHNIAPFTPGSIEVLEPVTAEFIDCEGAGLAASSRTMMENLAHSGFQLLKSAVKTLVLPEPLFAARRFASGGLSGSVRNFSPFGGVDPVGIMTPTNDFVRGPNFGAEVEIVPEVSLATPTGRPLVGIPVAWTVTAGGGSVGNAVALTNANGLAGAGSWRFGFTNPQTLTATAQAPAGFSFLGSPFNFQGIGH